MFKSSKEAVQAVFPNACIDVTDDNHYIVCTMYGDYIAISYSSENHAWSNAAHALFAKGLLVYALPLK